MGRDIRQFDLGKADIPVRWLTAAKKVVVVAGGIVAALASVAPVASAQTTAAPNCQSGSSYGTVVSSAPVKVIGSSGSLGTVQLCRNSGGKYWGFLLLNNPPTASQYGQAYITRYLDGNYDSNVSCDSSGGNGKVLPAPPQTRCWTPQYSGVNTRYTFEAQGAVYSSHTGDDVARGYTARTR